MPLFDIKKKLYGKKDIEDEIKFLPDRFSPKNNVDNIVRKEGEQEDIWEPIPKEFWNEKRKRIMKISLVSLGLVLLLVFLIFGIQKFQLTSFQNEKVAVSVSGPDQVRSGKDASYDIYYNNDNRVSLEESVLTVYFPDNFKPDTMPGFTLDGTTSGRFDLGSIDNRGEGKITFSGRAFGSKDSLFYVRAELSYKPSNFSSRFSNQNQLSVRISSSPVSIEIEYPESIASGDEVNYLISYKNTGEESLPGVRIEARYPDGFEFLSSDPVFSFSENSTWRIDNLAPGAEGKILLKGKLSGNNNDVKSLVLSVGFFSDGEFINLVEDSASIKVVGSSLSISQMVNEKDNPNVNAGQMLNFQIDYRNDGNVGLRDVIVTEKLEGEALDFSTLELKKGGFYDSNSHKITWKAVNYPELANLNPGQNGTIKFSIEVKENLPIKKDKDKNFVITSLAKIDSPDIPTPIAMNKIISSDTLISKVNSVLRLETLGYYNDPMISSFGPLPPEVDKETSYAIHWKVSNASNDLEEARVEAFLPTWASFTGKTYPEDANLKYNERANSLTWEIGNLSSGVGILNPQKEVVFQIKIKPAINQVGGPIKILEESVFSGKDVFTGDVLSVRNPEKTTRLMEDKIIADDARKQEVADN